MEGFSEAYANVSALPLTVRNIASSVDKFDSRICALEDTSGLEVGGGSAEKYKEESKRSNGADGSWGNGG